MDLNRMDGILGLGFIGISHLRCPLLEIPKKEMIGSPGNDRDPRDPLGFQKGNARVTRDHGFQTRD